MNMHITRITNVPPIQHFCFGLIISWFFRRRLVDPSHRNFTSPRFSASRPHCVIPLKRGCGWTEVSLSLRMCHRLKCIQHLLIARALTARTLPLSNPLRNGYIGCNPTDAGQVVLAYLQSGFPFQDIRGMYRKTPIHFSRLI